MALLHALFLQSSTPDWWTNILIWLVRLITLSLLLRTYLIPWLFAALSDHIRMRSISLWSIRGLYVRKGTRIYRVDRISYGWSHGNGLSVRLDGLNIELRREPERSVAPTRRHKRGLTLADFAPSPVARRLLGVLSKSYTVLEPYFRPPIRTYVVACLRVLIRWLPHIVSNLRFDLHSTSLTFPEVPGTQVLVDKISLQTNLSFTQLDKIAEVATKDKMPRLLKSRRSYGVAAWRRRFADSFRRTLDRAWGTAHGTASLTIELHKMAGSMQSVAGETIELLRLPGAINFDASLGFNPRHGSADTHSLNTNLNIGDCFIKLDALNLLLNSLKKPRRPLPFVDLHEEDPSASPWPFFSPISSTGNPSSTNTGGSGMISPQTSAMSSHTESTPLSAVLSSDMLSPVPQGSPFLEALSASLRHRRRHSYQRRLRLKDTKNTSVLSVLKHASIKVSTITLSAQPSWGSGLYEAVIQDVKLAPSLHDDSTECGFHQHWLGRGKSMESYDPDIYRLELSIQKVGLERRTRLSSMRLLTIGTMDFQAYATQWPAPWLTSSPFMCGDPNAPFLAIRAKIEGLDIMERMECLRQLVSVMGHSTTQPPNQPWFSSKSFQVPRLALQVQCGMMRGRIVCADAGDSEPFSIELRNNGILLSAESSFGRESSARQNSAPDSVRQPLRMDYNFSFIMDPTLIRVRSGSAVDTREFTDLRSSDPGFQEDPSMMSMESFEVQGEGHAVAFLLCDTESVASVLSASPILDLRVSTDTLCVEMWNPRVMKAFQQLLCIFPSGKSEPPPSFPTPSKPLLDGLPTGVSMTVALAQLVILITGPDLNPHDTLELSRGVVFRTSLFVHYSSMRSTHAHRFHDLPQRTQTRHKLYLPQELVVDAVSAAHASAITHNASAYFRVCLSDIALRSAVATQYDSDNPLIFEQDDRALDHSEFFRIPTIRGNLCLMGKRGPILSKITDTCEISIVVAEIRTTFQLSYVYAVMLALRSAKLLVPPSSPNAYPRRPANHSPQVTYRFNGTITTVQALCVLPTQRVAIRIDGINAHVLPNEPLAVQLTKVIGWVRLPSRVNIWDDDNGYKFEEMLALHALSLSLPRLPGPPSIISVESDSARLRIPFGYVLANLITDITVTTKAIRHLDHITSAGRYTDMPIPEAEGPKTVPNLTMRIRCLGLEASDDSLESKLAIIWRCGLEAAKQRLEREDAFVAKVAAIYQAESEVFPSDSAELDKDYNFGAKHSISIEEARRRLNEVHELDWTLRLQNLRTKHAQSEDVVNQILRGKHAVRGASAIPNIVEVTPSEQVPPLFRILLDGVSLAVQAPSFPSERLPDFLHEQGGLPRETHYSLLVPLHLQFVLSSLHVTLRDYPLPLFSIPPHTDPNIAAWHFETDLVIAEEMGSDLSVDWIACPILEPDHGVSGASPLTISVPKTIMPVKSYANPVVHVKSKASTIISWGVSYMPGIQDLMKVMESLSSSSRDSSPGVGFWDKIRMVFHWSLVASFKGEVRFHMKGSRDPHVLTDEGAGFVLSFHGNTKLLIGRKNDDKELIQVISDSMFIAIPNLDHLYSRNWQPSYARRIPENPRPFRKICAKLRSGVRFGVGFVLERTCGEECPHCSGSAFHRKCRYFDFLPHHQVKLEKKVTIPAMKGPEDSYNNFRSDFIHLSISLASSTRSGLPSSGHNHEPSSLHLTPKAFTHFWSWCDLFGGAISLPTRQGTYYPARINSPKLGRHIATLKYRVHLRRLFFMHAYIDESRETWVDGVIPWIGVKGVVDEFQADMHQRDEESIITGILPDTTKVLRRKPFYAAEVALKGLDLRALLATFDEPLRKDIEMTAPSQRSNYRSHQDLPSTVASSVWHDADDFIETDWSPSVEPDLHLLPVVTCPQFTYFKRNSAAPGNASDSSKFGREKSHTCMLGKEQNYSDEAVPQVQIAIATHRIHELRKLIRRKRSASDGGKTFTSLEKMVALLEDYIALLEESEKTSDDSTEKNAKSYLMPSYAVSPDEWAEFENVYQVHCPKIIMTNAIRDIMVQYYYCSRARRGFEYHMATRAVKFIRDQADAALETDIDLEHDDDEKPWGPTSPAQMAASALKKILKVDQLRSSSEVCSDPMTPALEEFDPLSGWSDGVSLRKNHCCLLLKPQIVMRGEAKDALIVAAVQAKLQIFAIMDDSNADDPISGKVMSRSYTSLSGLQTFAPAGLTTSDDLSIPLEVLMDLRCESNDFDRLVPQTDATFRYDKFNRLRLRNNITSVTRTSEDKSVLASDRHLQDQTDLIQVHIPRFTVSANDEHFQAISNIVTKLLLFSDAAHKTRLEKLETLLFTYDFTDLAAAANVVADLQNRLGEAIESLRVAENNHNPRLEEQEGQLELLKLKAHIFLLSEELNFLFDAIRLAQDRFDDHTDQRSALLLHASSSEISWRMLDDRRDLLAKLVVQDIDFYWLSRQDSSTGNTLTVRNLQAFDGSRYALWTEILSKYNEPANHPLLKRGLFLLANWTILAPVGGITIYESFELSLHPMRLQIDARVGRRIMEYLWPARRHRHEISDAKNEGTLIPPKMPNAGRTSLDLPRTLHGVKAGPERNRNELMPPTLRRLGSSRSFTDLRASARDTLGVPRIRKAPSSETLRQMTMTSDNKPKDDPSKKFGDAAEMKTRASQKSFVLVRISSLNLLLSVVKEGSFECHDARIRTRDLEYRNQTSSFEELVNQFIPSNTSWTGWVKMAFHQPLLPVLPVARELFSKTKWITSSSKAAPQIDMLGPPPKLPRAKVLSVDDDSKLALAHGKRAKSKSQIRGWRKASRRKPEPISSNITALQLTDEPESFDAEAERPESSGRQRLKSLFSRTSSRGDSMSSSATLHPSEEKQR